MFPSVQHLASLLPFEPRWLLPLIKSKSAQRCPVEADPRSEEAPPSHPSPRPTAHSAGPQRV